MTDQSRREFLKKLAQGSIYTAPVVSTLLAPPLANGQALPSQMMMMGVEMGMNEMTGRGSPTGLAQAPWSKPPPGR